MEFCPNCGMRMKASGPASAVARCVNCGYEKSLESSRVFTPSAQTAPSETVVVVDEEASKIRTMATVAVPCPKCGHGEAFVWMVQTRGADEASTQFFRCTRCSETWREYA